MAAASTGLGVAAVPTERSIEIDGGAGEVAEDKQLDLLGRQCAGEQRSQLTRQAKIR
jgi:hypothetical protein